MKQKRNVLTFALILFIILNINLGGSASEVNRSLQWFPAMAVDNDTIYIAWADERNGNYTRIMNNLPHKAGDIYLSKARAGRVFDRNIRINEIKGSTGHGSPSIAVDDQNLYLLWEDDRYGFEELYFSTSAKDNIGFMKDIPVVADGGSQVLPSVAVRNRIVYIAMMNKKSWDIDFAQGRPVNDVYRFEKPVRVNDDPPGNWHYAPSLAVDDENNVCIAWLDARNGNYDIYFSHGTRENGRWEFGKNTKVNDDLKNASHYTPSIAFDNGRVYIAWYDDRNNDFDIFFATGRPAKNGWEFDKNIRVNDDAGNTSQMHPSITVGNGDIFVAWEDEREGLSNIYFSKAINGSFEFGKNIRVNDINGKHYDPQIGISGNSVFVVWQAEITDGGDIYFSGGSGGDFGRSIKVNDDMTDSFTKPDAAILVIMLGPVIGMMILVAFLSLKKGGELK